MLPARSRAVCVGRLDNMPELPISRRRALLAGALLLVVLLFGSRLLSRGGSAAPPPPPLPPPAISTTVAPPARVVVGVVGAVRRPGLYRLAQGGRVADAVARAGGATRKADLSLVNLAALVSDGEQVVVPRRGSAAAGAAGAAGAGAGASGIPTGPVHLNSATIEQLDALDRRVLLARVGGAERPAVTGTGPPRRGRFGLRLPARVTRFGRLVVDEPALLELPLGRAPPQGARLEVLGELVSPRGPSNGFDEAAWLRRQGVHVVLRGDRWRMVGRRGGLPGLADRFRAWLGRSAARGLTGERRGIVEGVVLGDDAGLSDGLRRDFRASGLYHLLAVSGQNVALVAGSALFVAWLVGLPRLVGHAGALGAIGAYVLAVGAQPSVVRAAVAGALGSL